LNLAAKVPNAALKTLRAFNYTTRRGANKGPAFLFKHQRHSTKAQKVFTGKFAFYRQFICFASVY
jgi:hypothetical protein